MLVRDVLEYLKYGELANTQLADDLLDPTKEKLQVYSYLNRAVSEINKEFSLNQQEYHIDLKEGVARYYLSGSKAIKIMAAYKSDGTELSMNNDQDPLLSLFTPTFNVVEYYGDNLASGSVTDFLSVIYLREYDKIISDLENIPLSEVYLSCITSYIGYLAQQSLGIVDNAFGIELKRNYQESMQQVKTLGMSPDMNGEAYWLTKKGFV